MSGPEPARRLTAVRADTKGLYMCGYTSEEMLEANAALLPKPFTLDALARKVREALDSPRSPR